MKVDVAFSIAKVYDVTRFDVVKGESFDLLTDYTGESKWFSDNDPVLELTVTGNNAKAKATEVGTSTILIMDGNKQTIKELIISVVDAIVPQATTLGLKAEDAIEK